MNSGGSFLVKKRGLCCEIAPSTPVIKYDSIFVERIFHALHVVHALWTEQPPYIRALSSFLSCSVFYVDVWRL